MSQWSRFKRFAGLYASPLIQPECFVADVVDLLRSTGACFLLPGHDETEILARYRSRLPTGIILPVAEYDQLVLANNKARMADLANQIGLPVPAVIRWSDIEDLECKLHENTPLVVKLRRGNSAKGVFYPRSAAETLRLCAELCEQYDLNSDRFPVVQERVEGQGWGVSCLYWDGERIASFTHRRLREKSATGGTSTLRVSARNPKLEQYAYRLLDAMGWHGLAMVEFKYEPATDQGWFIEVNPRLWGSIHLAVASGVDFPALLYRSATEGPEVARRYVKEQQEDIVARWYLGDAIVAVGELMRLRPVRALRVLMPGGADTIDDWHWDDPGAFLGQAFYYLANFLRTRSLNPTPDGMLG